MSAQGYGFTYQGRLVEGTNPANGHYDFRFRLATDSNGTDFVGPVFQTNGIIVSGGAFAVTLNFESNAFTGASRWLEISVRTNTANPFVTLAPLQSLTPSPYAIMANSASNLVGVLPATSLSGPIPNASLPANPTFSGNVTATAYHGNGIGLTNVGGVMLNATNPSGAVLATLPDIVTATTSLVQTNDPRRLTFHSAGITNLLTTNFVYLTATNGALEFLDGVWSGRTGVELRMTNWTKHFRINIGRSDLNSPAGGLWFWPDHGGAGKPEWVFDCTHSIAIGGGMAGYQGNWPEPRLLQLGIGEHRHGTYIQSDTDFSQPHWGVANTNLGWSGIFVFKVPYYRNGAQSRLLGAQAFALNTNGLGELAWFGNVETYIPGGQTNWQWASWQRIFAIIGGGPTESGQGVDIRGQLRRERKAINPPSTSVALDYFKGGLLDLTLNQAAAFYTTNFSGFATNSEELNALIRSGGSARTLSYPTGWTWMSETGATAPVLLPAKTILRLNILSIGSGETNKLINFTVGTDQTL